MVANAFDRRNLRRYSLELAGSISLYVVLLTGSLTALRWKPSDSIKAELAVLPVLGFALMLVAIYRAIQRLDELQRKVILEILAGASAATAFITITYGFLELFLRFPRLSMFAVWMVMGACWLLTSVAYALTGRGNPFWPKPE